MTKFLTSRLTYPVPNPLITSYFRKHKRHKRQTAAKLVPCLPPNIIWRPSHPPPSPFMFRVNWFPLPSQYAHPTTHLFYHQPLLPNTLAQMSSVLKINLPTLSLLKLPYFPSFHFCFYFLLSSPQSPHTSFSSSCFAEISFKRSLGTSCFPDLKASLHYSSSFT